MERNENMLSRTIMGHRQREHERHGKRRNTRMSIASVAKKKTGFDIWMIASLGHRLRKRVEFVSELASQYCYGGNRTNAVQAAFDENRCAMGLGTGYFYSASIRTSHTRIFYRRYGGIIVILMVETKWNSKHAVSQQFPSFHLLNAK